MRDCNGYFRILAAALVLTGFGCGGKDQLVKLEGVVTLDGQPLEGAIVSFLPDGRGGRFAQGTTAPDGSFRLTSYKEDDGVLPGGYRVTVTLIPADLDEDEAKAGDEPPAKDKAGDGKNMMAAMVRIAAARQKALEKSPVPAVYRDGGRTPLRQTVPAKGRVILALQRDQPQEKPAQTAEREAKQAGQAPVPQEQPARP